MEISKQGIDYKNFDFEDKTSQIGGDKTTSKKVNFTDGLTKSEIETIAKKCNDSDGIITEEEFVEVCLSDDETFADVEKDETKIKEIFQGYFKSFFKLQETEPEIKVNKNNAFPESMTFGSPKVSLSNIKTGNKEGEYFSEIKMDGKTYKRTNVTKRLDGVEKYILEPDRKDGSKIIVEREPNGTQRYIIYGKDKKKYAGLELDNNCEAKSIFRYDKNGNAYEREYFNEDCIRAYEYDEKNNLVSSKDYGKNENGSYDKDRPRSMQKYKYIEGLGCVWDSRVEYEYDDNNKQSIKSTGKYDYNVEESEDGNSIGKLTVTKKVYEGNSKKDKDLITNEVKKYNDGILLSSEENEKDKKTTKFKINPNGTSTTTITEGDKKTVIEKDKKGNITSKKVTENGITRTTTYKDGEEKKTTTDNFNTEGFSDNVQSALLEINTDELPDEVKETISAVSLAMLDGEENTENAKTEQGETKDDITSHEYKTETTTEGGKKITYTYGTLEFSDKSPIETYKCTEVYEGKKPEGVRNLYEAITYKNGNIEFVFDTLKEEETENSKRIIINKENETIIYYTTNKDGEEKKVIYDFNGKKLEN